MDASAISAPAFYILYFSPFIFTKRRIAKNGGVTNSRFGGHEQQIRGSRTADSGVTNSKKNATR
ncbi:hypothetical protein ACQUW0_27710, partial [Ralstonia pseudosolanacearum]|uniref:hypothetical protein n=1 Tax=Ralstonia pseudosolanacearum TaxID=1310165 RepID=UPI003D16A206